jgi:hypothetical protein
VLRAVEGAVSDIRDGAVRDVGTEQEVRNVKGELVLVPEGTAVGTISGNTLPAYQKGGTTFRGISASATIQNNTLTGFGQVGYIAQNEIQVSFGGSATVKGNTVSGNWYTPTSNPLRPAPLPGRRSQAAGKQPVRK